MPQPSDRTTHRPDHIAPAEWAEGLMSIADKLASQGSEPELRSALAMYQDAAATFAEIDDRQRWADANFDAGNTCMRLAGGQQQDQLRAAIGHFERTLEVHTIDAYPFLSAMTHARFAEALLRLSGPDADQCAMAAVAHLRAAVTVDRAKTEPTTWDWARRQLTEMERALLHDPQRAMFTALRLEESPVGDRSQNLRYAIELYEHTIARTSRAEQPRLWAVAHLNLGIACDRLSATEPGFEERAIAALQAAFSVDDAFEPGAGASTRERLGDLLLARKVGGTRANRDAGLEALEAAAADFTAVGAHADARRIKRQIGFVVLQSPDDIPDRLPRARAALQAGLPPPGGDEDPASWAGTAITLASLVCGADSGQPADPPAAVALLDRLLAVLDQAAHPMEWATAAALRGHALLARQPCGHDLQVQALQAYAAAARRARAAGIQLDWQRSLVRLMARATEWAHPALQQDALPAFEAVHAAMDPALHPDLFASVTLVLGNLQRKARHGEEGQAKAIAGYRQALQGLDRQAHPLLWAALQGELGYTLGITRMGRFARNVEEAIEACEQAREVFKAEQQHDEWATATASLGNAYMHRSLGDRSDNIERAMHAYRQAIEARQALGVDTHDDLQIQLAECYLHRRVGDRSENIEAGIAQIEAVTSNPQVAQDPERFNRASIVRGRLYDARLAGDEGANLEQALASYEAAKAGTQRDDGARNWMICRMNLSGAYLHRNRQPDDVERAIALLHEALGAITPEGSPVDWAHCQANLCAAYVLRQVGDDAANRANAEHHAQLALNALRVDDHAQEHFTVHRNLGRHAFDRGRWDEAYPSFAAALQAGEHLFSSAYTEAGRRAEIGQLADMHSEAAYCLLQLGRRTEALDMLEKGKTRLLAEMLALADADLSPLTPEERDTIASLRQQVRDLEQQMRLPSVMPGEDGGLELALALKDARSRLGAALASARAAVPDFMPTARSAAQLQAAVPPGGALVLPMTTSQGGAVFILVEGHPPGEQLFRLDQHACAALRQRVAATNAREETAHAPEAWQREIEATCATAWTHLMQPLQQHLAGLGVAQGASVVLLPQGELSLLPLHAASPGGAEGTPALGRYTVSYCPSGYALIRSVLRAASRRGKGKTQPPSLLAVVDPTGDLPFARREGEAIAASFDPTRVLALVGAQATKAAITSACAGRSCVHFGCHGRHVRRDPLRSRLQLAQGQALTMADILTALDLQAASLVTLSACDTGLIDVRESPDEFTGLPAEFLQAGATTVVSTLWAVNDLSTMLLMQRFYERHILHGEPPARALCEAQRWLRDQQAGALAEYFGQEEDALMQQGGAALAQASEQFARFAAMPADAKPFAHPYHWAPFVLNGDPGAPRPAAGDMT